MNKARIIRIIWTRLLLLVVVVFVIVGTLYAVYLRPFMKEMMVMHTIHYDKQLTLVTGGGGNSGILLSDSLVLVVDTKMDEAAKQFYDTVKQLAGARPIIVVNTHIHSDHSKGNSLYKGATIIAGARYDKSQWISDNGEANLPTQWVKDSLVIKVGDETVTILNLGFNAHTQSDVVVYLHNRQLVFTGDLVLNGSAPALLKKYQASARGYLAAFDTIERRFEIKTVVPGHGDIGGRQVIEDYRNFFADMFVASMDNDKKSALLSKYKNWKHIPVLMSPDATVSYIKGEKEK